MAGAPAKDSCFRSGQASALPTGRAPLVALKALSRIAVPAAGEQIRRARTAHGATQSSPCPSQGRRLATAPSRLSGRNSRLPSLLACEGSLYRESLSLVADPGRGLARAARAAPGPGVHHLQGAGDLAEQRPPARGGHPLQGECCSVPRAGGPGPPGSHGDHVPCLRLDLPVFVLTFVHLP